jgi:hypothetical protein
VDPSKILTLEKQILYPWGRPFICPEKRERKEEERKGERKREVWDDPSPIEGLTTTNPFNQSDDSYVRAK